MKINLTVFVCILCMGQSLHAQPYRPMPEDSAYWAYRSVEEDVDSNLVTYVQLMVNGTDTSIDGYTYQKITMRMHQLSVGTSAPVPSGSFVADAPDVFVAGMRTDNKKVYFHFNGAEFLYYDFTLGIGDTLPAAYWANTTVIATDSLLLGGEYHKVYQTSLTSPAHNDIIVEGVGGIDGLLRIGMPFLCFRHGSKTFKHAASSDCNYIFPYGTPLSIGDQEQALLVSVGPNPVSSDLSVVAATPVRCMLFNVIGQRLIATGYETDHTLKLSHLPAGYYLLQISNKDGRLLDSRKLIKV